MAKSSETVRSPKREAIGVILLALCLLSFLCVFSFDAQDIGFLHDPPASPPHNLVGPLGAWFAFIGFLLFGIGGYLVPFVLLTGGLMMTFRSYERVWPVWAWLTAGLISLSSFFEYQPALWAGLKDLLNIGSAGGLVGQVLAIRTLGRLINHTGAGIIFITVFILALLQLTGMHPFTPFAFLWEKIKAFRARRKEAREEEPKVKPVSAPRFGGKTTKPEPEKIEKPKKAILPPEPEPAGGELFTPPVVLAPKPEPKVEPVKPLKPKPVAPPPADELANVSVNIAPGRDESGYQLPPLTILDELPSLAERTSTENTAEKAKILQATLEEFGVDGQVTHVETGPTVTSYEITPASGVRVERISALERNIALALRAQSIRIQAPIPGKGAVGIEVPNTKGTSV
jgi:S-DNA-T family DNA segregation ATPase FtsK/SpoIIIE